MASILIVDDHLLNRKFLLSLLGYGGHRLFEASDGIEALDIVHAEHPDLVITDILMPQMDGYEFVSRLRKDPAIAATPVIFYTATYREREARVLADACRVKWVLAKPSTPETILDTVREALGLPQQDDVPLPLGLPDMATSQLPPIGDQLVAYLDELETATGMMSEVVKRGRMLVDGRGGLSEISERLSESVTDIQSIGVRLTALIEVGIKLALERDPAHLLRVGCHAAQNICTAKYAMVGMLDGGGQALSEFYCRGLDANSLARLGKPAPRPGILGELLEDRMPHLINHLYGDPRVLGLPPEHPPVHSFLGVAISSADRVYGWLYVVDKLGADGFDETEKQTVATIAAQVAVAYENLLLYAEVKKQHAKLAHEAAERQRIMEELQESNMRFRQLAENVDEVFILSDRDETEMLYVSPAYETIWGHSCASLLARPDSWMDAVLPEDLPAVHEHLATRTGKAAPHNADEIDHQYRIERPDGDIRWIHARGFPIRNAKGDVYRIAEVVKDITKQKMQEQSIERLSRLYAVLSGINSAIIRIHDRDDLLKEACRVAVTHGTFSMAWAGVIAPDAEDGKIVGWAGCDADYVDKLLLTRRMDTPHSDRLACIAIREARKVVCNDIFTTPSLLPLKGELLARGQRSIAALPLVVDQQVVAVISLFSNEVGLFDQEDHVKLLDELAGDLSFGLQFIEKEKRLDYLAYYDALTGLPNAMLFNDRLARLLQTSPTGENVIAVILLDLERFAQLNDALGRHTGDAVLQTVANRLKAALRDPWSLARISSDTFAIVLEGLQRNADAATQLQEQILQAIEQPLSLDGEEVHITANAGIAVYPEDGHDTETLFKHAEVALYKAKSSSERYCYYAPQMNAEIAARLLLEKELRNALDEKQFIMYYQPCVDLLSGQIVRAEALIRWRHPQRGMIAPAEFIPIAEETGLIIPLGAWIIDAVCTQQAAWRAQGIGIVPVAVNLSAVQFQRGKIHQTIREAMRRHGLEQRYVEFELTESTVMEDPEEASSSVRELKELRALLSLDDFGTGYSSLAYLKRFPFDFVKIDRSFVTDVTTNPEDAAIVTAIIAMAHSLDLAVVAEGVETEGQLRFLRRNRCDAMQGYYFSRPVPAAEFEIMLREHKQLAFPPDPEKSEGALLIVDDEPGNLSSLRRLLRQDGYRVLTAGSGQEGLDLLAVNDVQVIISDQRMPTMSGSEFLGVVKSLYPDTIRIILSGYANLDTIADSVNQGAVFKFLTKPWDDEELREHIRDAFRRYRASA
jgi:diguanylate cyclase (GGDEF)-like protein/PAS domain S-box-containing protein